MVTRSGAVPTRRIGGPKADSASKRSAPGARSSRTPASRWTWPSRWILISAKLRKSPKACQRCSITLRAASTSAVSSWRGGAVAQAPRTWASRRTATRRRLLRCGLGGVTLGPKLLLARLLELLLHRLRGPVLLVRLERSLPRGDGLLDLAVLEVGVTQVIEDLRILLGPVGRSLQLAKGLGVLALLVIGPPEAVDEVAVLGIQRQGLLDQVPRLGEVDAALGVHVGEVVVRLGVLGVDGDDAPEGADGILEALLFLPDHAELEVQVAVLVVERHPLLQDGQRPVVLRGTVQRRAEVEKELRPLGLDVDRLAQDGGRLLIALRPAVEEAELDAGVHGPGVRAQDPLELGLRLGVLAGLDEGCREEVASPEVPRLQRQRAPEGGGGPLPLLLLVLDRSELDPHAGIPGRRAGQRLDLLLGLLEAPEPEQQVSEPLDEGQVARVGGDGLPVGLGGLLGTLLALEHKAQRRPRAVLVGVQLGGPLEPGDGLVPRLGLDGDSPEQIVPLGQAGTPRDQAQEDDAGLVVGLLLEVLLGERQVRVRRLRGQRDHLLQLGLGLGELALPSEEIGQGEVGGLAVGRQLHRLLRRLDGLGRRVGARQPLSELDPERRGLGIALDGLAKLGNGFWEAAGPRVHLRGGEVVIRLGAGIDGGRPRDRGGGLGAGARSSRRPRGAAGHEGGSAQQEEDRGQGRRPASARHEEDPSPVGASARCRRASRSFVKRRRRAAATLGSGTDATSVSTSCASSVLNRSAPGARGRVLPVDTRTRGTGPSVQRSAVMRGP